MTLLARLDRIVYATRLDRIIFMTARPRSFRWTPLVILAALVTGYAVMATSYPDLTMAQGRIRDYFLGCALFYGAYIGAAFLRAIGPRFTGSVHHQLDERELAIKARANAIAGMVLVGFVMLACFYMACADVLNLWRPSDPMDWISLGFGIQASSMLLPTWIASWLQPRPDADEEG